METKQHASKNPMEESQIENLTQHLNELEKEEQTKPSQQKEGNHKDQRGNQ